VGMRRKGGRLWVSSEAITMVVRPLFAWPQLGLQLGFEVIVCSSKVVRDV
jgi:hypothetical protein